MACIVALVGAGSDLGGGLDWYWSAEIFSEAVTPSEDPIPPEARVLVNGGSAELKNLDMGVTLSFEPYDYLVPDYTVPYDDIVEMMISNDLSFAGASWQTFVKENVPWTMAATNRGEVAKVYVRFKDDHGNETVGVEIGSIVFNLDLIFLPIVSSGVQ